ncbi:unnamed protein product [Parnassius apollo]|uniref:(apollo) hypothetical protein n=1 Tax=Parnassius apollo TaxID=110799 RepID=A0A8S3XBB7_PARAO|nr:unnamed protein product [Parnassius apollo]
MELNKSEFELDQYDDEIISQVQMDSECSNIGKSKRNRDVWMLVKKKEKIVKVGQNKIEVYISSNEKLPKQFGLARVLKEQQILDISRVKYLNPYKVRLDITNEKSVTKLKTYKALIERGWKVQKAMEKSVSYGVIRDVDMELGDKEILKNISCPNNAELLSIKRLQRRSVTGSGWVPSESIQLCFKGSFLPAYVHVEGLWIKVDPYVLPVSQFLRC